LSTIRFDNQVVIVIGAGTEPVSPEDLASHMATILDPAGFTVPKTSGESK
jgi:hypothetical protein